MTIFFSYCHGSVLLIGKMENGVFGYEWNNVECVLMLAEEGCRILIFRSLGANYSSVLADDFPGQVQVILGPRRVGIVQDDRQTVARTFAELHVSLNHLSLIHISEPTRPY